MVVIPWPEGLRVTGAGFWRQDRVSVTHGRPFLNASGVWERRRFVEDRGSLWRATLQVDSAPARGECDFGRLQSFLMQLRGGVNLALIHDPRYCRPMGTARTRDDWGRIVGPVTWDTGAHWEGGAKWRASGGVVLDEAAEAGAKTLKLLGGFPGDQAICAFDRVTIGGEVYVVEEAEEVGAASLAAQIAAGEEKPRPDTNFTVRIFDGLKAPLGAGAPVLLGGRFSRVMEMVSPDAANNFSRAGGSASQTLEFAEA